MEMRVLSLLRLFLFYDICDPGYMTHKTAFKAVQMKFLAMHIANIFF